MSLDPVPAEARQALSRSWEGLPSSLRTPNQFLGRQYAGCAATIGVMPRCDFTCSGCYLGEGANHAHPKPLGEIVAQLKDIRAWLGPGGNLQITDGEATLRGEEELAEIISRARAGGLVPMLMTHGETFRRRPGLLERLMEAGLTEVCFHVDTTMRGRRDGYAQARTETELDGLRAEFAEMIRRARRSTGRRLEAASTVTVTRRNLERVAGIVRWFLRQAGAFKMVSFQPAAQVGRTEPGLGGRVGADELWAKIAEGARTQDLRRGEGWLGHPQCSRFVQGLVVRRGAGEPEFHPLYRRDQAEEMGFVGRFLDRLGGATFRLDSRTRAVLRALRIAASHGPFLVVEGLPYAWRLLRRAGGGSAPRLAAWWLLGRAELRYFNIVSHHFMSREELETPLGQERLTLCAFRVPIEGRMESMCSVNASGLRESFYREGVRPESLSVQS